MRLALWAAGLAVLVVGCGRGITRAERPLTVAELEEIKPAVAAYLEAVAAVIGERGRVGSSGGSVYDAGMAGWPPVVQLTRGARAKPSALVGPAADEAACLSSQGDDGDRDGDGVPADFTFAFNECRYETSDGVVTYTGRWHRRDDDDRDVDSGYLIEYLDFRTRLTSTLGSHEWLSNIRAAVARVSVGSYTLAYDHAQDADDGGRERIALTASYTSRDSRKPFQHGSMGASGTATVVSDSQEYQVTFGWQDFQISSTCTRTFIESGTAVLSSGPNRLSITYKGCAWT